MEQLHEHSRALAREAVGPMAPHIAPFTDSLIEQRYAVRSVYVSTYRAIEFDRWLMQERVALADINEGHVARYYQERSRGQPGAWRNELCALRTLLRFLRSRDAIASLPVQTSTTTVDEVVHRFTRYLRRDRGLAPATIESYAVSSHQFLREKFGDKQVSLNRLRASDLTEFVQRQATHRKPRALKNVTNALRSFLRYAEYCGDVSAELVASVPAIAAWATTPPLPRSISTEHSQRILAACDNHSPTGLRDHAILLLPTRLGLRSCEIVAMRLDDVEWETGRLRVRGKRPPPFLRQTPAVNPASFFISVLTQW